MKPKITKGTYKVDGKEKAYYIIRHEFRDNKWDIYWGWDILAFGEQGGIILAIWDSKNLIWISPDAFSWEGAIELIQYAHNQINQPAD